MIKTCPHCNNNFSVNHYDTDYVHRCNSNVLALDQDDVLKVGDYIEEVTLQETTVNNPNLIAGNKLVGTKAGMAGEKAYTRTVRGNKANLYRQRAHQEYVGVKG